MGRQLLELKINLRTSLRKLMRRTGSLSQLSSTLSKLIINNNSNKPFRM
jgi:hypothetical protein